MSTNFQTAVRTNVARETRIECLDRLAEEGDVENLRLFIELDGTPPGLRRYALDRLVGKGASAQLAKLAADRALEPSLREEARRHA